jgi:hypothetical protein
MRKKNGFSPSKVDTMTHIWLIAMILVSLPLPLHAQQTYGEFERGLNLSDSQREQVHGIKRRYVDEWRGLKEEAVRKRVELRELNRERPDQREKAERVQRELDQIQASKQRLLRQYSGEVSTIFNEEQRNRFNRFRNSETRRSMRPPPYQVNER